MRISTVLAVLSAITFSGCATYNSRQKSRVAAMVGQPESALLADFGVPTREKSSGDTKAIEYVKCQSMGYAFPVEGVLVGGATPVCEKWLFISKGEKIVFGKFER